MGVNFSALNLQITETGGQERLKTLDAIDSRVEKMSETSRAAFKAMTADQQKAYLSFVGGAEAAAESTAAALTKTVVPAARRATVAVAEVGTEVRMLSHSGMIGLGELARGFGRVVETGQASAFAMREFSGAAMRLGGELGPAGGLAGIFVLLGGVIVETFMKARREIEETRKKFQEEIAKMANAGDVAKIEKQQRDLLYGLPYDDKNKLRAASKYANGAFEGSLADLEAHFAALQRQIPAGATMAPAKIADEWNRVVKALDEARTKFDQLRTAALNVANQPSTTSGLLPMITSAAKEKAMTAAEMQKSGDALFGLLSQNALQAMGIQTIGTYGQAGTKIDHKGLVKASDILPSPSDQDAEEMVKRFNRIAETAGQQMAATLGRTFSDGFTALFARGGGGKQMFKAMTAALLEGIGEMFMTIGEKFLAGLSLIATIKHAIESFLPEVGIPGAIALIALGAALRGAGARVGSASSGGGGGGGYSYSSAPLTGGPIIVNPGGASSASSIAGMQARPSTNNYITLIGKDDPRAQRELLEIIDRGGRRRT